MRRKSIFLLFVFITILTFSSPGFVLADNPPEQDLRIISLTPSITEILFSLELDDNIVGVSSFCNYPARALAKEKIGSFSQPNIEKIISLKPDLILLTGLEQRTISEKLTDLGLNVLIVYPSDISSLYSSIRKIGQATGSSEKAEQLIEKINQRVDKIKARVSLLAQDKRKTVFIEIWHDPIITAGPGSFVHQLIELAGGINIVQNTSRPYLRYSPEAVISQNPDCIILGYMVSDPRALEQIKQRTGWGNILAIKNNRVFGNINPDLILRPGPRFIEGAEEIYKRLYE